MTWTINDLFTMALVVVIVGLAAYGCDMMLGVNIQ